MELQVCEKCRGTGRVVIPTASAYPMTFWCVYCGGWGCIQMEAPHA